MNAIGLSAAHMALPASGPARSPLVVLAPYLLPQVARCWAIYAGAFFLVAFIQGNGRKLASLGSHLRPQLLYAVPALAAVGLAAVLPKMG